MIGAITTKLEIDVMQAVELVDAVELASVNKLPAIIVHPELSVEAAIQRSARQGKFKIITPVDWPKGEEYAMKKMQSMNLDALSQDGFEILVSARKNVGEIKNELKAITEFIRTHLDPMVEIRFVLGTSMREKEMIEMMCNAINEVPTPNLIRTDHHTRIQQSKANTQIHNDTLEPIGKIAKKPMKISGNISTVKTISSCPAQKYGVNLKQAQSIIKELKQDPEKIKKLFAKANA